MLPNEIEKLSEEFMEVIVPVGSQVTCNPPPPLDNSDIDFLCLCNDVEAMLELEDELELSEWKYCSGEGYEQMPGDFNAWRKDIDGKNYNLILTTNNQFFDDFMDATKSCKALNLLDKKARCAEFARVFAENKAARRKKSDEKWIKLGALKVIAPGNPNADAIVNSTNSLLHLLQQNLYNYDNQAQA